MRDNICYDLTFPIELKDSLGSIIEGLVEASDRGTLKEISTKSLYPLHQLASRRLSDARQNWSDLSSLTYKCLAKPFTLTDLQLSQIKIMYKVLYPDANIIVPRVSFWKCRHIYMGTELYGSVQSRTRRALAQCLPFGPRMMEKFAPLLIQPMLDPDQVWFNFISYTTFWLMVNIKNIFLPK